MLISIQLTQGLMRKLCNGSPRLCLVMSTSLTVPGIRQGSLLNSMVGYDLFDPSLNRYVSPDLWVFQSRQINPNFRWVLRVQWTLGTGFCVLWHATHAYVARNPLTLVSGLSAPISVHSGPPTTENLPKIKSLLFLNYHKLYICLLLITSNINLIFFNNLYILITSFISASF